MWRLLHGENLPFPHEESSQLGHGHVLSPNRRTHEAAMAVLHRLLQKAAMRLRHSGRYAGALGVAVDYRDNISWREEMELTEAQDTLILTSALNVLWARRPPAFDRRVPLRISVRLDRLIDVGMHSRTCLRRRRRKHMTVCSKRSIT